MSRSEGTLRLGLTDAGKVVVTGIGFVALTALVFPAFGVLSILVWVVLLSLLAGFLLRPKIEISPVLYEASDRIMAGQSTPLSYVLKNVGRFPAHNLCVKFEALPEGIEAVSEEQVISRLDPDETITVTITIQPRRRGYYQIRQPTCRSSFPFNLFSFGISHNNQENLIVLPAFYALRMPAQGQYRQVQSGSTRPAGRMGCSTEYAGNRPFLPGDSPRQIDARAWARLAVPATREYHDDFDYYTALVLDTHVPDPEGLRDWRSQPREIKELEAAVSLCASIAFTIDKDRLIDLLLAGPDLHRFTDCPRMVRLDRIHEILAGVEPSRGCFTEQTEPILMTRIHEISEIVFILLNWNQTYQQMVKQALQAGCHTKVLLVGRPPGIDVDQENEDWVTDIRLLSADEILSGQVESL
ncbi:MAG: hypothetical protein A2Z25_17165 [Planctomycetes bacterium RBG_16_55_9]|nr:MAG: hypothetical protein A2Z25_17165 [Planctomycetes bacterium RBG_16_55_9]